EPEALLRCRAIHVGELAILGNAPNGPNTICYLIAEKLPHNLLLALITGCGHNQVGLFNPAVLHQCTFWNEPVDFFVLKQTDLALDNEVATSAIEIVASVTTAELHLVAGIVGPIVKLEAACLQAAQEIGVNL